MLDLCREEIFVEREARRFVESLIRPRIAREFQHGSVEEARRLKQMLDEAIEDSDNYISAQQVTKRRLEGQ